MSRNISASMKTASVWVQVLIKKKELMEIFLQAGKFKKRTADKSTIRFFCEILPKAGKRLAPAIDYTYGYKYNNSCGIVADGDE